MRTPFCGEVRGNGGRRNGGKKGNSLKEQGTQSPEAGPPHAERRKGGNPGGVVSSWGLGAPPCTARLSRMTESIKEAVPNRQVGSPRSYGLGFLAPGLLLSPPETNWI